jgi:hypothetical protein
MNRRFAGRRLVLAVVALVLLVVLATVLTSSFRREPAPASPAVLEQIAEKNEKAAVEAAARQKIESEAAAEAADQAVAANEVQP